MNALMWTGRWWEAIVSTAMVIVATLAAAAPIWMIYPMVLAAVVIIGGLVSGEISPVRVQTQPDGAGFYGPELG